LSEVSHHKKTVLKGVAWSLIDQFGIYFVKLLFGIVIARLLSPNDFGLIGIIVIFIAIGTQLSDSGFQMALIQKKNADKTDFDTVFVFNLLVSLMIYIALFFSAEYVSKLYDQPDLIKIIRISSLNIIVGALSGIQIAILIKKLDFKTQAKINFIGACISGGVGVTLAYLGFGFWSLVAQTLAGTVSRTILLWYKSHWIPSLNFNWSSFKTLFGFGSKIFGQGLIDNFFSNIYNPLIGKIYSIGALGFYSKAKAFTDMYTVQISLAVSRVAFPTLSNFNSDQEKQKRVYSDSVNILIIFFFAATLVLFPLIEPFVLFALTEKWLYIVPLMQLLIFDALFYPVYRYNVVFIEAQGKSGTTFILEFVKKSIMFIALLFTIHSGILAIICGILISSAVTLIISWSYLNSYVSVKQQIQLYLINIFIAGLTLSMYFLLKSVIHNIYIYSLVSSVLSLSLVYLMITLIPFEPFIYTKKFISDIFKGMKTYAAIG
jgi:teichuronic acid exporter